MLAPPVGDPWPRVWQLNDELRDRNARFFGCPTVIDNFPKLADGIDSENRNRNDYGEADEGGKQDRQNLLSDQRRHLSTSTIIEGPKCHREHARPHPRTQALR